MYLYEIQIKRVIRDRNTKSITVCIQTTKDTSIILFMEKLLKFTEKYEKNQNRDIVFMSGKNYYFCPICELNKASIKIQEG